MLSGDLKVWGGTIMCHGRQWEGTRQTAASLVTLTSYLPSESSHSRVSSSISIYFMIFFFILINTLSLRLEKSSYSILSDCVIMYILYHLVAALTQ